MQSDHTIRRTPPRRACENDDGRYRPAVSLFITLEGIEGCGKSSQASRLAEHLRASGAEVVLTREPGGTDTTLALRKILADPAHHLDGRGELLLFLADRAQHVATLIQPALDAGKIVLCDRYIDSTMAYQGYARGHDRAMLSTMNKWASYGLTPDLTLWIDCDVETGLSRARRVSGGPGDRFEDEQLDFHRSVRSGFAEIAGKHPDRVRRIDGNLGIDEVFEQVREQATALVGDRETVAPASRTAPAAQNGPATPKAPNTPTPSGG